MFHKVDTPITKHFGRSFSNFLHFECFKMLYKCLFNLYNSSLKCKAKGAVKKIEKNTFFSIAKHFFFHFCSFWPFLLHKCITFSCFVQIEQFKLFWNIHLKLYKSSCNSKGKKIIFKDFLSGLEIGYELFDWKCFVKMTPPTLGSHNFFNSNPFLLISSATDVPREGFHLFLKHHKQWGPPTKMANKLYLKCLNNNMPTLLLTLKI